MSLLSSVGQIYGGDLGEPEVASISPWSHGVQEFDQETRFQYFPETISDTKGAEYATNTMPGASHPIRSFVAGTDRTISFQAVFTRDRNPDDSVSMASVLSGGFSFSLGEKNSKHTVEIDKKLAVLRSYILPHYKQGICFPPPIIQVNLPGSGIYSGGKVLAKDSFLGIMLQCDITYESFHRNGAIRYAVVSLTIAETVQTGDEWGFMDRKEYMQAIGVDLSGGFYTSNSFF